MFAMNYVSSLSPRFLIITMLSLSFVMTVLFTTVTIYGPTNNVIVAAQPLVG